MKNLFLGFRESAFPVTESAARGVRLESVFRVPHLVGRKLELFDHLARGIAVAAHHVVEKKAEQHREQVRRVAELVANRSGSRKGLLDFGRGVTARWR